MKRYPFERPLRDQIVDGWASFCRFPNPIKSWESAHDPEELAAKKSILGGISLLVAPLVFLCEVGTSAVLDTEIKTLRSAVEIFRRRSPNGLEMRWEDIDLPPSDRSELC
jgi:hypothetical protein